MLIPYNGLCEFLTGGADNYRMLIYISIVYCSFWNYWIRYSFPAMNSANLGADTITYHSEDDAIQYIIDD